MRALLLAVLALLLAGCRLDVIAPFEVRADGTGRAGLTMRFDPELLAELDRLGVDPTAELGAAVTADQTWEWTRTREDGGALLVEVHREVEDATDLPAIYERLVAGLADDDPALVLDLDLALDDDGGTTLVGTASLRPPVTSGLSLDGELLGPDAEELAALVAESVTAAVEVSLPGDIIELEGGEVDGEVVRIPVPVGETTSFRVVAAGAPWWATVPGGLPVLLAGFGGIALLIGGLLVWQGRRARHDQG
ncbi:MAG: hypothetical protein WD638_06920 [Nitriliruptoraceae bacterium]